MTREEAQNLLNNSRPKGNNAYSIMLNEAFNMAIKALKQMPVTTTAGEGGVIYYPQVEGVTPTVVDAGKQEPCSDAISRENAIIRISWDFPTLKISKVKESLDKLPPVNPTKTGHWIPVYQGDEIIDYRCSECEFGNTFGKGTIGMNFCPVCGAWMVEPQEKSDKE